MNKYEIDFYKKFGLETPTAGLIYKILSPKGKRKLEKNGQHSYHLNSELVEVYYINQPTEVTAGLYWIMDVCKLKDEMNWCHYLFIVEDDGSIYPVAEFLKCHDTQWVKKALTPVKSYFSHEKLEPIELTEFPHPRHTNGWRVRK